jgi:hypothetical protein
MRVMLKVWEEAVMTRFTVLSQHFLGVGDEDHDKYLMENLNLDIFNRKQAH